MSYETSLHEKDGAFKADAKIAGGVDDLDNSHPLNCTTDGTLEVAIDSVSAPIDVIVDNVVPVSQSGTWTVVISGGTITAVPLFVSPLASGSITGIPTNTLSTIVTYTAAVATHLSRISVSGNIYAKYQLFLNTVLIETKRSGPERSLDFFFDCPLTLSPTSILDVKVMHYQTSETGDFESTVYGG